MRDYLMIGNVVIPSDVDRESYIQYALKTNTVCVITDDGDFIKNAPIAATFCGANDGWFIAFEFPPTPEVLGSQVVMINVPRHDIPIVIGCLRFRESYTNLTEEGQMYISRVFEQRDSETGDITRSNTFKIEGNGLRGILSLIATSTEADGGKITFDARNNLEQGELVFRTNFYRVTVNKEISLISNELMSLVVKNVVEGDEFAQIMMSRLKMILDAKEIEIGTEDLEPIVKGDKLNAEYGSLNEAIQKIVVATPLGNSSVPLNASTFAQLADAFAKAVQSTKTKIE